MTVDAVIFDIGNVLIRWDPEAFYDARIGAARRRQMFETVPLDAMNLAIDRGADFRATVYDCAETYPDFTDEIRLWHDCWSDFVTGMIDGSVAILRDLRASGMPVHALSNFGLGPLAIAEARFPFLRDFDRRYISGAMGVVKPDPAIYAAVEADLGVAPEAILFTDDKPENIAAARARGWRAHLFEGPEGLCRALRAGGVTARSAA